METSKLGAGDGKEKPSESLVVQPRMEVRTVREVGSTSWPMLTRTNYGEWAVHMKWKLRAHKYWAAVETGNADEDAEVGAMEALLASTPAEYHEAIGAKNTAKEAWEMLASFRIGSDRAKKAKAQQLRREFDDLRFKSGETVEDFALRLQSLAGQLATYGKPIDDEDVVAKLLRVVPPKYAQLALSIETMLDLSTLSLEDVTGRLRAVEDRSDAPVVEDSSKLLLTEEEWTARMKQRRSGEGSSSHSAGKRRGKDIGNDHDQYTKEKGMDKSELWCDICEKANHSTERCWKTKICNKCKKKGHIARYCRSQEDKEKKTYFMEKGSDDDGPTLLAMEICELPRSMSLGLNDEEVAPTICTEEEALESNVWYLDNGASNHMTGQHSNFVDLDESISGHVKFGDGSMVQIKGKGSVMLQCKNGERRLLNEVYYVPKLCRNIISLGQLSAAGNRIVLDGDLLCVRERSGKLLMKVRRTPDMLYKIELQICSSSSMEKKVSSVECEEKVSPPRQDISNSGFNSSNSSGLSYEKRLPIPPLALMGVKSKGEIHEQRNLSVVEDVAVQKTRYMAQDTHGVMKKRVWRPKDRFTDTEVKLCACSYSQNNRARNMFNNRRKNMFRQPRFEVMEKEKNYIHGNSISLPRNDSRLMAEIGGDKISARRCHYGYSVERNYCLKRRYLKKTN